MRGVGDSLDNLLPADRVEPIAEVGAGNSPGGVTLEEEADSVDQNFRAAWRADSELERSTR